MTYSKFVSNYCLIKQFLGLKCYILHNIKIYFTVPHLSPDVNLLIFSSKQKSPSKQYLYFLHIFISCETDGCLSGYNIGFVCFDGGFGLIWKVDCLMI